MELIDRLKEVLSQRSEGLVADEEAMHKCIDVLAQSLPPADGYETLHEIVLDALTEGLALQEERRIKLAT